MYSYHPAISSFPIALLVAVMVLEIYGALPGKIRPSGAISVVLIFATVAVIGTFFSGYQASDVADQSFMVDDAAIAYHHVWGRALLLLIIPCAALQLFAERASFHRALFRTMYLITLGIGVLLAGYTSFLGGRLVFEHGAGVFAVSNSIVQEPTKIP